MLRQYFAQEENAEPFPPKYEEVADDAAVLKGQMNRKSVSLLPDSDDRKKVQAERFVGIDDRQMKEDMLCLRHDPDIKGQAPCVKGVHTSSAAEKFRGCAVVAAPSGSRQFSLLGGKEMETRVAVISMIVENPASVEILNGLLHEYSLFIIGRMGIPYPKRGVSIITVAMDAPQNTISSLSGKLGGLSGVSVKTAYSGVTGKD